MIVKNTLGEVVTPILIPSHSLREINRKLADKWGYTEDQQNFRLSWSEDLLEKRWTQYTREGFELLTPQLIEVPKYRQWIQEKYIVERLTFIDGATDLTTQLSYEPIYTFEDKYGNPTLPLWHAIDFMLINLIENMRNPGSRAKYKETNETIEEKRARINQLAKDLFGNESDMGDSLAYKEGVGYTGPTPAFSYLGSADREKEGK